MKNLPKLDKNVPVEIVGAGYYLPERVLTNSDLEKMVDTNHEWITERTGIHERRIASPEMATSDLAICAAKSALENAKMDAMDVDLIICGTITPDMQYPSTACFVQKGIGAKNAFAFDLPAACTGFIYALSTAYMYLSNDYIKTALVIGAEKLSTITDYEDRNTCVLFGDGAGAVVLKRTENEGHGLIDFILESDGRNVEWLEVPGGGSRNPATKETLDKRMHFTKMKGREVFKFAVTAMKRTTVRIAERNNLAAEDITWLIPHQANKRIIDAASQALGLDQSKIHYNIQKYGNMSSASTAVGLAEVILNNDLKKDDYLLLVAFGAGMTWGSALIKW